MKIKIGDIEVDVLEQYTFKCPFCSHLTYGTSRTAKTVRAIVAHITKCEYSKANKKCLSCKYRTKSPTAGTWDRGNTHCNVSGRRKLMPEIGTCDKWEE